MAAPLIRLVVGAEVIKKLPENKAIPFKATILEPLVIKIDLSRSAEQVSLSLRVTIPDLAPYSVLQFRAEIGVVADASGDLVMSRALERAFTPPEGDIGRIAIGTREAILKCADRNRDVVFGLLVNDLVLIPDRSKAPSIAPLWRAFQNVEFATRRLRGENTQLKTQLKELEESFNNVLSAVCPESERPPGGHPPALAPAPAPAPTPAPAPAPPPQAPAPPPPLPPAPPGPPDSPGSRSARGRKAGRPALGRRCAQARGS